MISGKAEVLYETLRQELVRGTWRAGQCLPAERVLGERYGVSRTVVRSALDRLAAAGLLTRTGSRREVQAAPQVAGGDGGSGGPAAVPRVLVVSPGETNEYALASVWRFDPEHFFFADVMRGLLRVVGGQRIGLRYLQLPPGAALDACLTQHGLWEQVNGVLAVNHQLTAAEIAALRQRHVAIASFGPPEGQQRISYVDVQNTNGMYQATRHLLAVGRRRIAVAGLWAGVWHNQARIEGYRRAYGERGIQPLPEWVLPPLRTAEEAQTEELLAQLRPRRGEFDGLILSYGWQADKVLPCLQAEGWDVPREVGVIVYDDMPDAPNYHGVPMTCVRQPFDDMAENALQLLLQEIADPLASPVVVYHQPMLIVRESCGARLAPLS